MLKTFSGIIAVTGMMTVCLEEEVETHGSVSADSVKKVAATLKAICADLIGLAEENGIPAETLLDACRSGLNEGEKRGRAGIDVSPGPCSG